MRQRYTYQPRSETRSASRSAQRHCRPAPDWLGQLAKRQRQRNLAPYSFFNCFNYHPPIIGFASSGWKDSVQNISETGEFVWNRRRVRWQKP